jgi:transposase-like protein
MSTTASPTGAAGASGTGERAVPYSCPFCGEEDLRPLESGAVAGLTRGGWHCRSCLRVFSISFHGVHAPVLPHLPPLSSSPLESERS